MADREQITEYLQTLFSPEDRIELVAVKEGVARRKEYTAGDLDLDAIDAFEAAGWNVYCSVLPFQLQEANRYDRVWIDMDDTSVEFSEYWPKPTTLVQTSENRWQAIWRLDESLGETEGRSFVRRLAEGVGGDTAVHDRRRVLRIPGVTNAKRGQPAVLQQANQVSWGVRQFEGMVAKNVSSEGVTVQGLLGSSVNDPKWVLGEWLEGCDEGDRARKAYVTARFLKSCQVSFEDAIIIVNTGAQRAVPVLSEGEVIHATRSAYNRQD